MGESMRKQTEIDLGEAMKKQKDVAMFLAGKLINTTKSRNSNLVFSPASINTVVTMAAATSGDKRLRSSLLSLLRSSSMDELNTVFREITSVVLADGSASGGPKIAVANGFWIEQSLPFSPAYKDLLVNFFKSDFRQVNFRSKAEQVRKEVNKWVSDHTNGLIKDVLTSGSVTNLTNWIYGNALYFKGAWENEFDKSLTVETNFHLLNGESVSTPFMRSYESQFIKAYDGFKVLKLPYRQGRDDTNRQFSMYFYLPDEKDGLNNLLQRMTSTGGFLDSHIPKDREEVGAFRIPKFKIEFGFEFPKSSYQKALIEIDEEGTEAAAVTFLAATCTSSAYEPERIDFVADHPFIFLIREDITGTVLFAGQICDPSKSV
ncbi:unnamed protein product [Microthlaspi erraticum]|uniref:Serpin domain-containing protein n=1 Tax=Microthlaspi erraticum TaxID=1685480 RepID=A0A6D2IUR7_9BRAS|nr:unnamed protein product [Microthlaspi erraticum]